MKIAMKLAPPTDIYQPMNANDLFSVMPTTKLPIPKILTATLNKAHIRCNLVLPYNKSNKTKIEQLIAIVNPNIANTLRCIDFSLVINY